MYKPIELPYSFSALEPYIDKETMKVHFNNHYIGYIDKLNKAVAERRLSVPLKYLIENVPPMEIRNNGGGYFNHSLFFRMLRPPVSGNNSPSEKTPMVNYYIKRDFGSYANFQKEILDKALGLFGSGWVWWIRYPNGQTEIVVTANQDNPIMFDKTLNILLGIDVWEHAYYLKYKSFRDTYIKNIFNVINWEYVETQFYRG